MSVALNFNDGFDIGPQFYKFLFAGAFRMANGQRGGKECSNAHERLQNWANTQSWCNWHNHCLWRILIITLNTLWKRKRKRRKRTWRQATKQTNKRTQKSSANRRQHCEYNRKKNNPVKIATGKKVKRKKLKRNETKRKKSAFKLYIICWIYNQVSLCDVRCAVIGVLKKETKHQRQRNKTATEIDQFLLGLLSVVVQRLLWAILFSFETPNEHRRIRFCQILKRCAHRAFAIRLDHK